MNILTKLTVENLKKNRRRTFMTVMGAMLSTALIMAVAGMVSSFQAMMIEFAEVEYGDYHDMFEEVPRNLLPIIESNPHAKVAFYSKPLQANAENISEADMEIYQLYQNTAIDREDLLIVDEPEEVSNVFVRYDQPKNYQEYRQSIQTALENESGKGFNIRTNSEMLRNEGVMSNSTLATLYWLMAIVIAIIIVTSVFAIRNSFSISANERTKQFGMLGSIGATPKQIRHSVITEGLIIAALGIPLGIVLGMIALLILIVVINLLMEGLMVEAITLSTPLWIFIVAILLGVVTIFLSSLMPAIQAGRMSPVEALRGAKDVKLKPKKLKTNRLVAKCFGIGGTIAHKNLQRSRKKYRTTVISIVVAVATFIGLTSFMTMMTDSTNFMYGNTNLDLGISNSSVEEMRGFIKDYNFTDYAYYISPRAFDFRVLVMNAESFEKFAKQNGIRNNFDQAVLVYDFEVSYEDGKYSGTHTNKYPAGSKAQVRIIPELIDTTKPGEQWDYTKQYDCVGYAKCYDCDKFKDSNCYDPKSMTYVDLGVTKVIDELPLGHENSYGITFVMSENSKPGKELAKGEVSTELVVQNYKDVAETYEKLHQLYEERSKNPDNSFFVMNIDEAVNANRSVAILIGIFLYGFLTVVTLIGVTNIFNVITTNIALRAKELAMLRSIGMTNKELNRMVRLESLFYTGKSMLIGLPLGIAISYLFYWSLSNSLEMGYKIPFTACIIATLAVALLIFCIMKYSVKQVEKQNIIETLREDNI